MPIRPGEHACCRFVRAADRRRAALGFVGAALGRGEKVIYLSDSDDLETLRAEIASISPELDEAIEQRQLALWNASFAYAPEGGFDTEQMIATLAEERERALADGYRGLSMTGEMAGALRGGASPEQLAEYEIRFAESIEQGAGLCQYDHGSFDQATLGDVAAAHTVDLAPELAPLARAGFIAGARTGNGRILRLAGELDYVCGETLSEILDGHFHGPLEVDLADLSYVDVAGMRTLRGRTREQLMIGGASEAVTRMVALLGWDTDPGVELAT